MYPISDALRTRFENGERKCARITLNNATIADLIITEADIVSDSLSIDRYCATGNKIEIGSAVSAELSLVLNNNDGKFDSVRFEGSELKVEIGINGVANSYIPCGYFTVDEPPRAFSKISLKALDFMMRFDNEADLSLLPFPCTAETLVKKIGTLCGVNVSANINFNELPNGTAKLYTPFTPNITYRQILQWVAQITGTCAYIDWNGELMLSWYKETSVNLIPALRYSGDILENDISITGVILKTVGGSFVRGTGDYPLVIEENELIEMDTEQSTADNVFNAVKGLKYRPYECSCIPMPYLYPLDKITYTDKDGNAVSTVVTNHTFGLNSVSALAAQGETQQRKGYATQKGITKKDIDNAITEAMKDVDNSAEHFYIMYSAYDGGRDTIGNISWSETPNPDTVYLGTCATNSKLKPEEPESYDWVKIRGADGAPGTSQYVHVKYSANSDGEGFVAVPNSTTEYMGVAVTTSSEAPKVKTGYTWVKTKGEQGVGIPGTSSYTHIKYSDDGGKTFTDENGEVLGAWIGFLVDNTEADSMNPEDYKWKKFTEDVDEELAEIKTVISSHNTDIVRTEEQISLIAARSYVEKSAFESYKEEVSSEFEVRAEGIDMKFNTVTTQINNVDGDLQSKFEKVTKHISHNENGVSIGGGKNAMLLTVDNDNGIIFSKNGVPFGWWDGNNFHTGNIVVEVNERAKFGNFAFIPRTDGSLSFLKVDGSANDTHTHSYIETVITAATCNNKGTKVRICSGCGTSEQQEIPALGHDYVPVVTPPTETEQGYTTYTCSRCKDSYIGNYIDATGCIHDLTYKVVAPTCTEQGYTEYTCTKEGCGYTYRDNYRDATGHNDSDNDGYCNKCGTQTGTFYTITVQSNNTSYGTVDGGGTYLSGKWITIQAIPNSGYQFKQWNDGNTEPARLITVSEDKTYTAYFEVIQSGELTITEGVETLVNIPIKRDKVYLKFVPQYSGSYTFESLDQVSLDPDGYIYNADKSEQLVYDNAGSSGFVCTDDNFIAGTTYYLAALLYNDPGMLTVKVSYNGSLSDELTITAGEIKTIDVAQCVNSGESDAELSDFTLVKFVPTTSGTYQFEAKNGVSVVDEAPQDTCGRLYDVRKTEPLAYNDDDGDEFHFLITYNCTAGETYYLAVKFYSNSDYGTVDLYVTDLSSGGSTGEYTISVGQTMRVNVATGNEGGLDCAAEEFTLIKFVPPTSGHYTVSSVGYAATIASDPGGCLFDSTKTYKQITDDDSAGNGNFKFTYNMRAGDTYYIGVKFNGTNVGGTIDVNVSYSDSSGDSSSGGSTETKFVGISSTSAAAIQVSCNGSVVGQAGNYDFNIGDTVTLYAEPISGYRCGGWRDDLNSTTLSNDNPYTFIVSSSTPSRISPIVYRL